VILPRPYYDRDGITIYHGDCREIAPLLGLDFALISDPPYGIGYAHSGGGRGTNTGRAKASHRNTFSIVGDDAAFDPTPWLLYAAIVLWGANHYAARIPERRGTWLAWDKSLGIGPADNFSDAEFGWTSINTARNVARVLWKGVVQDKAGENNGRRDHPSQKPLKLMRWSLRLIPSELPVLDPFMGSGTTLVAAKNLGRRAIGIEIEERYCEIAVERLAQAVLPLEARAT